MQYIYIYFLLLCAAAAVYSLSLVLRKLAGMRIMATDPWGGGTCADVSMYYYEHIYGTRFCWKRSIGMRE